jgi:hypothetical protein
MDEAGLRPDEMSALAGSSHLREVPTTMRAIPMLAIVAALMIVFGGASVTPAQPPPPPPPGAPQISPAQPQVPPPPGVPQISPGQPPVPAAPDEQAAEERTPPRLSYVDGQVSFWRPGAPEWTAAQVNTALAPGDELSTGSPGNFEVQIGARAFVRGWAGSGVGLVNQDSDFLQFKVTTGHASLDLRTLDPGRTVEIDTPNAAFTIDRPGYYRVLVQGDRTAFIARRGGQAIVTPANGAAVSVAASEEVTVEGMDAPRVASYAAPPLDEWDRWNYARTDYVSEAVSARYVSPGVYGVSDLDRYGRWRVVPDYGSVWVPTAVATGWVPYSTGAWTWDAYYGWTWTDTAPWGWAPFHYGRWVFVDSYWAWAPGPVVVRPAYAPALVAFFGGGPSASVRVGWCALGWGEPVIRWWGAPRFVGVAWWGGWGGPRVVNNVVINRATVVNAQNINLYRNVGVHNAVVVVDHQHFGRGPVASGRVAQVDTRGLEIVRGRLDIKPVPLSLVPTTVRGVRPSDDRHARPVVATRPPEVRLDSTVLEPGRRAPAVGVVPAPRLVPAPRTPNAAVESPRAPIGEGRSERPLPPPPPRFGGQPRAREITAPTMRQAPAPAVRERRAVETPRPQAPAPRAETPQPQAPAPRVESPRPQAPAPRAEMPRPQAPAPRVESPRPQVSVPRAESPRLQAPAPGAESPRPQIAPRVEAPRPQPAQRLEVPRPPARPLPGAAADRMSPGRGDGRAPGRPEGRGEAKQ